MNRAAKILLLAPLLLAVSIPASATPMIFGGETSAEDSNGTMQRLLPPTPIVFGPELRVGDSPVEEPQASPALAVAGDRLVTAWYERKAVHLRITGRNPVSIPAQPFASSVKVLVDGGTITVLWWGYKSRELHLRRFTLDLEPIDVVDRQFPLRGVLTIASYMVAAAGGGTVLIASHGGADALLIDTSTPEPHATTLSLPNSEAMFIRGGRPLLWTGTEYATAVIRDRRTWGVQPGTYGSESDIRIVRVGRDGTIRDDFVAVPYDPDRPIPMALDLASSPVGLLVSWSASRLGGESFTTAVIVAGRTVSPFVNLPDEGSSAARQIIWQSDRFHVLHTIASSSGRRLVYRQLTPSLQVIEGSAAPVTSVEYVFDQRFVVVDGRPVIAYARQVDTQPRLFLRTTIEPRRRSAR